MSYFLLLIVYIFFSHMLPSLIWIVDIIKAQLVDIILLDLKLPDGLGTDIVEYLHNNNLTEYLQSVIVVSGENELFLTIHDSLYVFSLFGSCLCLSTKFTLANLCKMCFTILWHYKCLHFNEIEVNPHY